METKICSVCGRELSVDRFRMYHNKPGKTWPYCKDCESIEMRRKYLQNKGADMSDEEYAELEKIGELYKRHAEAGRRVLGSCKPRNQKASALVDEMLASN